MCTRHNAIKGITPRLAIYTYANLPSLYNMYIFTNRRVNAAPVVYLLTFGVITILKAWKVEKKIKIDT